MKSQIECVVGGPAVPMPIKATRQGIFSSSRTSIEQEREREREPLKAFCNRKRIISAVVRLNWDHEQFNIN